jgi:hypothetical protein
MYYDTETGQSEVRVNSKPYIPKPPTPGEQFFVVITKTGNLHKYTKVPWTHPISDAEACLLAKNWYDGTTPVFTYIESCYDAAVALRPTHGIVLDESIWVNHKPKMQVSKLRSVS